MNVDGSCMFLRVKSNTPLPETNTAPENRESSIPTTHFQVLCYVRFREGRW